MARFGSKGWPVAGGKLYFTSFDMSRDVLDVTSYGESFRQHIPAGGEIRFSGVMPLTEGSTAIMRVIMENDGIDFLQERREWRCVYCGSPNPIEHRHCSQCAGPRGWIL